MFSVVRRRVLQKGPDPQLGDQKPIVTPPEDMKAEAEDAKRQVYLVTFPHPRAGNGLVAPTSMSRLDLVKKLMRACAAPSGTCPHRPHQPIVLDNVAVFHELHKENAGGVVHGHYHAAVKGLSSFRFAPVKKALQDHFQLASHWSCTHTGYWSPIRYCAVPSPTKPKASLDPQPLLWGRLGPHPPLHLCCHEPHTAAAMRVKRQRKEDRAAEESKPEPRMTEYELWPIVVESGIMNTPEKRDAHLRLMQYARRWCSPATSAFVFKNRARLPALIDDIWKWESIDSAVDVANQTLLQQLNAATSKPCSCGGRWSRFAAYALGMNRVDVPALCKSVLHVLCEGRSPNSLIVTLAGESGGEGKSFFIKGLAAVVGTANVFWTPTHPNFPLHGLEDAKIVILDEFRFLTSVVPLATQCLWFDGSAVSIAKPQTGQGAASHLPYEGRAPVFITTSREQIDSLTAAGDGDASMILRRLQVFDFTVRVAKPHPTIPVCPRCVANFVLSNSR